MKPELPKPKVRDLYDAIIREDRLWIKQMKALPVSPTDRQLLELDLAWVEVLRPLCLRKCWWRPWRLVAWLALALAAWRLKAWIRA
ncbi:MAG: hypothetical protein Q8O40_00085 [Chloroflexota bacterium]|nr:hypothetical protein [Chloroflexota bacterium]